MIRQKNINLIPIVLATDNNYALHCAVTITSVLINSTKEEFFHFYILDGGISEENKNKLLNLKKIKQFKLKFLKIDNRLFNKFHIPPNSHFSIAAYYRIVVPSLLPKIDKIIYLDCDLIVKKNIKYLYKIDISKYFIGAADHQLSLNSKKRLGIPLNSYYVNTGVLIINSKKWRENNIESKLFKYIKDSPPEKLLNVDQDAINVILHDYTKLIPQNWNTEFRTDINPTKKYLKIINNPYIIHYLSSDKPWQLNTKQNSSEYYKYLSIFNKFSISKKEYVYNQFKESVGYYPNIDNPKTFNEKIQWLKLYYRDSIMTQCADKYAVRKYIKEKIGEEYLIPLLGVYDNANEINFNKLPNKFVLKTNWGSGQNIIVKDKTKINEKEIINKLNNFLKPENNHYFYSYEWVYKNIKPKIICEKYIEQNDGELLDYKFLCFHGKPKIIWVDSGRNTNHQRNFFNLNWENTDIEYNYPRNNSKIFKKPSKLKKMITIAKNLSEDFPHVRIDLYFVKNKIFFGELTFSSENGMGRFRLNNWDYKIGKYLDINKINQEQTNKYLQYKKTRKTDFVIYTAISGDYEKLKQHKYISKDFDYVCFTNQKIKKPGIWKIEPLKKNNLDLTRNARYHKIFPHILLKKYKYSIWIDSNIDITSDKLEKRIFKLIKQKKTISSCFHFERDCIYQEAKACIDQQKDEPEIILKQVDFLKKEKYPQNNGLFETNILYRKHNDPKIIKTMKNWWKMIINFSKRDQLSFNYVLWKNKIKYNYIFPTNSRLMKDDFKFYDHNIKIISTLFTRKENRLDKNNFIQKIVSISNNKYKVNFNLENFNNFDQLQLNIVTNKFCQFKINKIKINNKKIDLSKLIYQANGDITKNKLIDFKKTLYPQIIFKIPKKQKKITIYGNIYFYNPEQLYIDITDKNEQIKRDLNQIIGEKEKLQQDLDKIQKSKTYKLWQKYNKFKLFLKNE